ncbi:MAG: hypothetical protein COW30_12650 [Rhodospirillales bacterium CG15_BIG_FIL_POST_REV_8_21_14_020_66_15]|nr:MAG: hypothetical protein COW30_12650 [Rhodospirillales bacterium CG15_BIG_FIL_POST_REV_8_21_14_020_66_15]
MDSVNNSAGGSSALPAKPAARSSITYESESLREVQARAHHIRQGETAVERRGMRRLNEALATGQELRRDVPRGFYLNITV